MDVIYIDNSNVVELRSLTNSITSAVDTGATVSVTIVDSTGTAISGETWPVSMSHASSGTYRATLSSSLSLTANRAYRGVVTATGSGGEVGKWNCPIRALVRDDY